MRLIIVFIFTLTSFTSLANKKRVMICNDISFSEYIGKFSSFYIDSEQAVSIDSIWQLHTSGAMSPVTNEVFTHQATNYSYWFEFTAQSQIDERTWLNIQYIGFDSIHFYKLNHNGQVVESYFSGAFVKKKEFFPDRFTHWFPVTEPNDTALYHIFIKLHTTAMLEAPILFGSELAVTNSQRKLNNYSLLFIGSQIIMFIFTLLIALFTRNKVYLYFSGYIAGMAINATFFCNFPIIELILDNYFTYTYVLLWISPGFVFITLFSISFFNFRENYPRLYKLINFELILLIITGLFLFIIPANYIVNAYTIIIFIILITTLFYYYYFLDFKNTDSLLFGLGWTVMTICCIVYIGTSSGLFPYKIYLRYAIYIGIIFKNITFLIALAQQIKNLTAEQLKLNITLAKKNEEIESENSFLISYNYHINHDLKTIINNVKSMVRMGKKYNHPKHSEMLNNIFHKLKLITQNGTETVKSFMSLSTTGKILQEELNQRVNFKDEILSILKRNNLTNSINVTVNCKGSQYIYMHPKTLEAIILNLLTNSIKYCTTHPIVDIEYYIETDKSSIIYSDNGIGFDMEKDKHKLFGAFERLNNKLKKEGTGLGLYLVKKIIDKYNGTIEVHSEVEKGTTFQIVIPALDKIHD